MYLAILILPLLGSVSSGFFGRKLGVTGSQIITCTCLLLSSVLITFAFYIISVAGAESVIGLSILVAYYRLRGTISLKS